MGRSGLIILAAVLIALLAFTRQSRIRPPTATGRIRLSSAGAGA